jgi:hypothetical protein
MRHRYFDQNENRLRSVKIWELISTTNDLTPLQRFDTIFIVSGCVTIFKNLRQNAAFSARAFSFLSKNGRDRRQNSTICKVI